MKTMRLITLTLLTVSTVTASDEKPYERELARLVETLDDTPSSFTQALDRYNRLERRSELDIFERHALHREFVKELERHANDGLARAAPRYFQRRRDSSVPGQIALAKALDAAKFPAPRTERIQWLSDLTRSDDQRLVRWGSHLLATSGWPEAIDELIDQLADEQAVGNLESRRFFVISSDLYHVLGKAAESRMPETIRENWKKMDRKIPEDPDYSLEAAGSVTVSFFGDPISPYAAFLIDTSTSMRQTTTLARHPGKTSTDRQKARGPAERKVDIVKKELVRSLRSLRRHHEFNVLSYNATVLPWRGQGSLKLYAARAETVKSAIQFTEDLKTFPGTNIHDATVAALEIEDVDTVYLLSDGVPSRGGNQSTIQRRVRAMNYLTGYRIITYGFAAEGKGDFDEPFMKSLASENWGWYRRLN